MPLRRELAVIEVVLLLGKGRHAVESWDDAPDLVEYHGALLSRRAGPRMPVGADAHRDPVAVYADDLLTEEEFQDLFYAAQADIEALRLKFD